MKDNSFYESLKCILTDTEKQEFGSQMAEAVARINEAEAELKSFSAQIKSRVAADEALVTGCSEKIRSGYEFRRVECQETKDYENERVFTVRLDTGALVREREMKPEERQKDLLAYKGETVEMPTSAMQEI